MPNSSLSTRMTIASASTTRPDGHGPDLYRDDRPLEERCGTLPSWNRLAPNRSKRGPGSMTGHLRSWSTSPLFGSARDARATEREKQHERKRFSGRKIAVSDDRREDQGSGRLAGRAARPAPRPDQASRARGDRRVEMERGSGVVSSRNDLHRRELQKRRQDDLCQGSGT